MTHQQAKKVIRQMVTLEVYEKKQELREAKYRAVRGTLDDYTAAAVAYAEFEADWVWRVVRATEISVIFAHKYWESVLVSMWLESKKAKQN